MASKLINICGYAKGKIAVAGLTDQTYISTENMLPNKGGITTAISIPAAENTQAYKKNDVLVSNIRPYFKKIWQAECDGGCSNDVLVFRAAEGVDPTYLYYVLADDNFFNYATATSKGTKMPRGDKSAIMEYGVPDFDIGVQRKIGSLLRSIDQHIVVNSKINDNLQQQLLALYSELFAAHDIQKTVELRTLCAFQEGYVNPSQTHPEYFDGSVKWLRAVDINESFIIETSRTLTTAGFESAKKSALLFQPNTIAISKSGTIGRLGIIADYMCGNRAVINIRPHSPSHLPLIYAFLKSKQKEFPDLAVGSVQKNLYISILEPMQVGLPEAVAVDEFCNAGCDILMMIQKNCRENMALANLRDALLPRLMSGEIDVSDIDI